LALRHLFATVLLCASAASACAETDPAAIARAAFSNVICPGNGAFAVG
jgi:hypothetical protein